MRLVSDRLTIHCGRAPASTSRPKTLHCCRRPRPPPRIPNEFADARLDLETRAASTTGFEVLQTSPVTCMGRTDRPPGGSRRLNGRVRQGRSNDRSSAARPAGHPMPSFAGPTRQPDCKRPNVLFAVGLRRLLHGLVVWIASSQFGFQANNLYFL